MNHPSVSVVMCTYNGSKYVDEQIDSILKQEYKKLELIIVDDNSSDNTWDKLKDWQAKSDQINIYKNDINLGYNKNFEKAISLASGDLIAIADQDDIWLPSKISKLVPAFEDQSVMLAHNRSVRLENGRLRFKTASLHHHFQGNDTRKLFMFNQVNGHDMMFRKQLVEKFMPIPDGMMYDWWIAVMATCYGKIASVNEYLVHHRIHADNSYFTKKPEAKQTEPDLESALKIFSRIDALNADSKSYLKTFLQLLSAHNKPNKSFFDRKLFLFLLKNRNLLFGHKRRAFPQLSYIKYAFKYARLNYNGKGLSL